MSDLISRRRLIKQLAEESTIQLTSLESKNTQVSVQNYDEIELHMFKFDDSEWSDFAAMDQYLTLDVNVDKAAIVAQIDELRVRFDKEYSSTFFNESRDRLIGTIANKFMLGGIVANQDRAGGNVDTIHNVRVKDDQGNLIYASDKMKAAYAERGEYSKDTARTYHQDKRYKDINSEYSDQQERGVLDDQYTGKRFARNADFDLDHTISAKEIHDDPGRVLAGMNGPELANARSNLNPTDSSINRSKKALDAEDFANRLKQEEPKRTARIQELASQPALTDQERKELNKLEKLQAVDQDKLKQLDREARQEYEVAINQKYYLSKEFLGNVGKTSVKEGVKMGLQQVIGLFLTEAITAIFDEIRDACKNGFNRAKSFWGDLKDRLERIVKRVISRWKEALSAGFSGLISGIFSNIVTVIINTFLTTAKNVVRLIREGFFSIVKAAKMLTNPPKGMTKGQAFHEAGKIIIAALAVSLGILLEEAIGNFPPMAAIRSIPIIGDLLYSVVFGFLVGLVTTLALWGWDKLDLFGVKESARHEFVIGILEQDRQQMLEQRSQWLQRLKEKEPERYLFLHQELSVI